MRAAIYLRVSTDGQTTANQERELRAAAERIGHEIVAVYRDAGISGSKGRDQRPGFDEMHKDAARRRFDVVIAWSLVLYRPARWRGAVQSAGALLRAGLALLFRWTGGAGSASKAMVPKAPSPQPPFTAHQSSTKAELN
jgi:hypothetical protein